MRTSEGRDNSVDDHALVTVPGPQNRTMHFRSFTTLLALSFFLLLRSSAARGDDALTRVTQGCVQVTLTDRAAALRSEAVAAWLAEELAALLPGMGPYELRVERRSMEVLYAVGEDTLYLHPRLPSASLDEELQVLALAAWLLLQDELGPEQAWVEVLDLLEPRRPTSWAPRWWPRCCRGLDALTPSPEPTPARTTYAIRSERKTSSISTISPPTAGPQVTPVA